MSRILWLPTLGLVLVLATVSSAWGQPRPYLGFAYPAGGQQGTTFQIKVGGQGLDGVDQVLITGTGIAGKVVEYYRKLSPQDVALLREQLQELRKSSRGSANQDQETLKLIERIQTRISEWVNRPASASLSNLAIVEVTVAHDAKPGPREMRLATRKGVSNPLVFDIGQLPEYSRKPMITSSLQVLGKEELALRTRPAEEAELRINVPCTVNGQIASGEVNRYRFEARRGQRLVVSTRARQLIPYIADAVPGWFQPVLALYDTDGTELAFNDDYRFRPDPVLFYEVEQDGEYVLTITDAIYRGREDFVYRVTVGELPFVTSIFPLGGRVGESRKIEMEGWNLDGARMLEPPENAARGVHAVTADNGSILSNQVPFALDELPECFEQESQDKTSLVQTVQPPIIINGRIDGFDDQDTFRFAGRKGETIVAEVHARRLDSPLDAWLKLTDSDGKQLAFNDDHEDPGAGLNTHHADSYLSVKLPADGDYYVHIGDTARSGGKEYAYRLRLSAPLPDFALRVVPSSVSLRSKRAATVNVYAIRQDGFAGAITLSLKDPPEGFSSSTVSLPAGEKMARLVVKTELLETTQAITLSIEGRATIGGQQVTHQAVPAEDRMQAFLWQHLVPTSELRAMVYDPSVTPPPKRVPPPAAAAPTDTNTDAKPAAAKFSKQQVAGRLRQLKLLFEEWLLTDEFYRRKVAECETAL